jgi:signal transduction histidine kinase
MNSIRRYLALRQLVAFGLLFGLGAAVLYTIVRAALLAEFDSVLHSKIASLCTFTKQNANGIEWEEALEPPSAFKAPGSDFFQIWRTNGKTLKRSATLGTNDWPRPETSIQSPRLWNVTLPNGQPGRALAVRYTPLVDKADRRPAFLRERNPRMDFTPAQADLVVASSRIQLDRTLHSVVLGIGAVGGLFLVGSVLIVRLSLRRGLAPLDLLAAQAATIDASSLQARFPTDTIPEELRPISQRLNDLLARLEAAFERERRFSTDIAHELRTPIGELRTLAEVALQWEREADPTSLRETLDIALQMEAIVTRLFDLARCEHDKLPVHTEPVALAALVQEVWQPFISRAEQKRLTVRFEISSRLRIQTDPVLLRAILGNLFSNAAEYTPSGGEISVNIQPSGPCFSFRVTNAVDHLTLDDLPHLFERFWRKDAARSSPEHCGLGLAVSKAFARQMGCCLDASLNDDSTLVITLSGLAP